MLKVGLSVCRVIDFKQRYVQISLLKLFALVQVMGVVVLAFLGTGASKLGSHIALR